VAGGGARAGGGRPAGPAPPRGAGAPAPPRAAAGGAAAPGGARGDDASVVVQWLAHTLTNRLLHEPTVHLREAGFHGDRETLIAARRLLGLPDDEPA
jgi:hypothetical protein